MLDVKLYSNMHYNTPECKSTDRYLKLIRKTCPFSIWDNFMKMGDVSIEEFTCNTESLVFFGWRTHEIEGI